MGAECDRHNAPRLLLENKTICADVA